MQKVLLLFSLFISAVVSAQDWKSPIPNDPSVKVGKLKNGIPYYIRKNAEPKNRMELRLIIKAGSNLETDDQQGLAHFMEHMNFNGTKNFPKNEIVDFLQRSGLKFGADLNAYTSFDETVYQLQVPTDSLALFRKSFQVLEDWAHQATLDTAEISKERGVVIEELRLRGKNAQERIQKVSLPLITNNARYASRLPIGTEDNLKNFKPETLRSFYKDWYARPDLMGLVVIGDFDMAEVERQIKEHFENIPVAKNPKKRIEYTIPPHKDTKVAVITDKEFPQNLVQIYYKLPKSENKTLGDFRKGVMVQLYNEMLGNRMQELTKKADPPFLFAFGGYGGFLGDVDVYQAIALAKSAEGMEKAYKAVLEENARVRKFGFTATELERAVKNQVAYLEKAVKEKDKTKSAALVNGPINNFLKGSAYTSPEFRLEFGQKYLPNIKLEELNALATQWMSNKENRVVLLVGPEKGKDQMPKEAQLLDWLDNYGNDVKPYQDNAATTPLLPKLPTAGKVASEKKVDEIGVTEWTLSNGAKVVLKPTTFKNDQIIVSCQSQGGTSLYSDVDFDDANISNALVAESGVGDLSSVQLDKLLSGKVVGVYPYVGEYTEGMGGSCSPKDLETQLQLLYSYFTRPRRDNEAIKGYLSSNRDYLKNELSTITPEKAFEDTIAIVLGQNSLRVRPMTPDRMEKINVDKALKIYNERFADASGFTFFFVGAFEPAQIKPLVEQYIASLPSLNVKESYKNLGITEPKGSLTKTVYKGLEDKASVQLHYSGDFAYSPEAETQWEAVVEALDIKLTEKLREEESGVYSPSVQGGVSQVPAKRFSLDISFGCSPANVEKLIAVTLREIEKIKANGVETKDLEKYKIETKRANEVQLKENGFWAGYLSSQYNYGADLREVLGKTALIDKVNIADTKTMANLYLKDNLIRFVLLPEKK